MRKNLNKRRVFTALCAAGAIAAGCSKDEAARDANTAHAAVDAQKLIRQIGVEPGPVNGYEGASAVLAAADGQVELRRLGEESFAAAKRGALLQAGDQLRVGEGARATVMFADESAAELAELSTLAIGSRMTTADPASSAAVLHGVARFSASPRAPGEGPFMVFTPAGLVATKGTVFGVGVAATGDARVGVESGAVDVAGAAAFDAPIAVEAGSSLELAAAGTVAAPSSWTQDDWGIWRDRAEAELDIAGAARRHGQALAAIETELAASYDGLERFGKQVADFELEAAAAASAGDHTRYQAGLPAGGAAIDASFLAALRLAWLTHAYESRATIAADLYVRHPDVVGWAELAPRVSAAVLWPKRLDAVALAYLEPLRVQYYLHHPRGRAHASFVGIALPEFYAGVTPPALSSGRSLGFKAFVPPLPAPSASARAVWIAAPSADWQAKASLKAAPARGPGGFWVRPPELRAKAMFGASVKARPQPCFELRAPSARGQLKTKWAAALGRQIKVPPPDLYAAASARSAWKGGVALPRLQTEIAAHPAFPELEDHELHVRGAAALKGNAKLSAPNLKANSKGKFTAPDLKLKAKAKLSTPDVKAKLKAKRTALRGKVAAGTSAKAGAEARVRAAGNVNVKLPEVRPPRVSGSVNASAKLSAGL